MIRAVLDTNIVISALVFRGQASALVPAWQGARFRMLVSSHLLDEYIRVLHYPKFHLIPAEVHHLIVEEVVPFMTPVLVKRVPRVIRVDPSDNHVLACASAGKANVIVSGDRHLLELEKYAHIPIVTLADFLHQIGLPQ